MHGADKCTSYVYWSYSSDYKCVTCNMYMLCECVCVCRDSYCIACLEVTAEDWRLLGLEALEVCDDCDHASHLPLSIL